MFQYLPIGESGKNENEVLRIFRPKSFIAMDIYLLQTA